MITSFTDWDVPDRGWVKATCTEGHITAVVVQQSRFELLSEMGIKAIINHSYRDAIVSFNSCLERLYEYFIEAECRRQSISVETFAATWKQMKSQSERQFGAFLSAYLLCTKETPKLLPRALIEFRNSVVHKGKFPTAEEAMEYCAAAYECGLSVLAVLREEKFSDTVRNMTIERIRDRTMEGIEAGFQTSTISLTTPLNLAYSGPAYSFEELVASYTGPPHFIE